MLLLGLKVSRIAIPLVRVVRLELTTPGSQIPCPANWATPGYVPSYNGTKNYTIISYNKYELSLFPRGTDSTGASTVSSVVVCDAVGEKDTLRDAVSCLDADCIIAAIGKHDHDVPLV